MTDIVDRLHTILDKYKRRYKRVGWQPVVEDAICEIRRLRTRLMPLVAGEDIVERLRLITAVYKDQLGWHSVILTAADEIERLRARLEEYENAPVSTRLHFMRMGQKDHG